MADHPNITLTMDTEENDDWIRSLPGYKNEIAIIDKAIAELAAPKVPQTFQSKLTGDLKQKFRNKKLIK